MFLKHVMSTESYVSRKGYIGGYGVAEKEHADAVYNLKIAEILFLASEDAPKGVVLEECKALAVTEAELVEANTQRIKVARKMFALYKNLPSKEVRSKWSNIVTTQIRANPWTDLKGKIHNLAREYLIQSVEDCVAFHLLKVFPQDAAEQ